MKMPNLRAVRLEGRRVAIIATDREARRTGPQKRVLMRNRIARLTHWMDANGVGHFHFDEESISFDDESDATLFYLAFA